MTKTKNKTLITACEQTKLILKGKFLEIREKKDSANWELLEKLESAIYEIESLIRYLKS